MASSARCYARAVGATSDALGVLTLLAQLVKWIVKEWTLVNSENGKQVLSSEGRRVDSGGGERRHCRGS